MHLTFLSIHDQVHTIPYLALGGTQQTKLCTAIVVGVHLHQPTHSLWGDTKHHNVYCIATTTQCYCMYIVHSYTAVQPLAQYTYVCNISLIPFLCLLLGTFASSQEGNTASNVTHMCHPCQSHPKGPYTLPGLPGRDGRDGKDGPPGQVGRDGVVGPPGLPGVSAMDDVDNVREIIRLLAREELYNLSQQICNNDPVKVVVECASATEGTPTFCPGATAENPADLCRAILGCHPLAPSGYYWITNGTQPHIMYCYMEADKCGVRGVMRVATLT